MPTNLVMIGGRTYTANKDDYAAVHALQDQYKLVPLSEWGKAYTPPTDVPLKPGVDSKTPVPTQVLAMSPEAFFSRLNALLVTNPPEPADPATMARIAKLGIAPGASFSMAAFSPEVRKAIEEGVAAGQKLMRETPRGKDVNGWEITLDMGRYGTNYPYRASWTFFGVGGNLPEDAVYPFAAQGRRRQTAERCEQIRPALHQGRNTAGERVLVADDVRRRKLSRAQRDQPLRARRPQRNEGRRRRLAHDLHPERVARRGQAGQLAAGAEGR